MEYSGFENEYHSKYVSIHQGGCELDKDYFEAQEKRFKTETMQLRLF